MEEIDGILTNKAHCLGLMAVSCVMLLANKIFWFFYLAKETQVALLGVQLAAIGECPSPHHDRYITPNETTFFQRVETVFGTAHKAQTFGLLNDCHP